MHACKRGSKVAVQYPLLPLNEGLSPIKCPFLSNQFHLSETLKNLVSVQKYMTGDHSVNSVISHDLLRILQTVLYSTDRHFLVCKIVNQISIGSFQDQFLTLVLTVVQNFVNLPYLELTFLETSYLSVFGLNRPMIYRPDELCNIFLQILQLPVELDIW